MAEILLCGHKNPDTDSIVSAHCYGVLKNMLDKENSYLPVRCGNLNKQTRFVFDYFNETPPGFIKDIYPKVADVMSRNVVALDENDPLAHVISSIDEKKIRIMPLLSGGNTFCGVVSVLELSEFFIAKDIDKRPRYLFRAENFQKIINGYVYRRGEREEFEAAVMVGAMPFDRYKKRMDALDSDKTVLIVGKRRDIIEHAIEKQLPAVILTGFEGEADVDFDFTGYKGWVYISEHDTAETLRRLQLSIPTKYFAYKGLPSVKETDYLDEAKDTLLGVDHKGLPVLDGERLIGIITRSDLIKKARKKLILMDHNELSQAVDGAETAEIVEIVDHHRLATLKTSVPIHFLAKPVGSTCTLVYEQYKINAIQPDEKTAGLLLAGILSDTVILKSPTATPLDRQYVTELSEFCGLDYEKFGVEMFSSTDSIKSRDAESVITTDFKIYEEYGVSVGIGQVEVVTLEELPSVRDELIKTLEKVKSDKNLNWCMLMVTDIISEVSTLLTSDFEAGNRLLAYKPIGERQYNLPGVLSRKKQLLPEIFRVLEEMND